jgi:hypothetical protein
MDIARTRHLLFKTFSSLYLHTSEYRLLLVNNDTQSSTLLQEISKLWYIGSWNEQLLE